MKKILTIILMMFCVNVALAQVAPVNLNNNNSNSSNSSSNSSTQSSSASQASNGGVTTTITNQSLGTPYQTIHYSGQYTVRAAPGIGMGGFSGSLSPDYCSGTAQTEFSIPGFGFGGGKPVVDVVCQKLRVIERTFQMASAFGAASVKNLNYAQYLDTQTSLYNKRANSFESSNPQYATKVREYASKIRAYSARVRKEAYHDADLSNKLAMAGVNIMCSMGGDIYSAYENAGISCPEPRHK